MTHFLKAYFVFSLLFLFAFVPFSTRAEESQKQDLQRRLTVKDVQASLEGAKGELSLTGLLGLQKAGQVVILDVRSKERHASHHIKGSINIPLTELTEKTAVAALPDKKTPVAVMCDFSLAPTRMLAMTIQAYPVLHASGYENIYRLNLWQTEDGKMLSVEDIEKQLPFEGSDVKK